MAFNGDTVYKSINGSNKLRVAHRAAADQDAANGLGKLATVVMAMRQRIPSAS